MQAAESPPLYVELGGRSYPIHIGRGLIDRETLFASHVRGTHAAIVSNETVAPLYLERVTASLERAGKQIVQVVLPDGEQFKDLATLERIYAALLSANADRKTTVIALGGGVIGDMSGFAAATYMRGVPLIQVPTTLLSQVDSSVGGKTAVNHPLGKNMIGAFYQPAAVIADLATLDTLPERELQAGLAEVIKHGAIIDAEFFAWIERSIGALLARDADALAHAVRRSCEIKAKVVRLDERESGVRALLNFGHTFGHAIETGLGYGKRLHGEAVGTGMVIAAQLSQRACGLTPHEAQRLTALIRAARLPLDVPALGVDRYLALMAHDKKAEAGEIVYVLLSALGHAQTRRVPDAVVREVLAATGA